MLNDMSYIPHAKKKIAKIVRNFSSEIASSFSSLTSVYRPFFCTKGSSLTDEFHKISRGTVIEDKTKSKKNNNDLIHVGAVGIPKEIESMHFLIAGDAGSGKSVATHEFLNKAKKRGQRVIVYDPTGELVAKYYKEGDIILNPFDKRNSFWTPFPDVKSEIQIRNFSHSLIPEEYNEAYPFPFRHLAPRAILSAVLSKVSTIKDLNYLIFSADESKLIEIVKDAGKMVQVGTTESFKNVRERLCTAVSSLLYIKDQEGVEPISLSKFIQDDSDSWIFIGTKAGYENKMKPLINVWLDILIKESLSLTPDNNRRIWYVINGPASLHKNNSINDGVTRGRKYGLSFILVIQNISEIYNTYGRVKGEIMLNSPQTKIFLRLNGYKTAEWASEHIGKREVLRKIVSVDKRKQTTSTSDQYMIEFAVLPSQIQKLENLTGYIQMPGRNIYIFKQHKERKEM
jgi:hypothetical protein